MSWTNSVRLLVLVQLFRDGGFCPKRLERSTM